MLDRLTSATFFPLTGDVFRAAPSAGNPLDLVLSQCEETTYGSPDQRGPSHGRVPFSLLFHSTDGRHVEQQIFTLSHPDLGEFPLFLVPLGPDGSGMRYEAVIS